LPAVLEIIKRCRAVAHVAVESEAGVSLSLDDASSLPALVEELKQLGNVAIEKTRAILCLVGEGLHGSPGTAERVFSTTQDINMSLIKRDATGVSLLFLADEDRAAEAVLRIHEEFFEEHDIWDTIQHARH
jgi:aspartate kinase